MTHPLASLAHARRWFVVLLLTTVALSVALVALGPTHPDIVGFELAWTPSRAREIVEGWSGRDRIRAGFSLGLDYLYLPVYSTTLALACVWGARLGGARAWRASGTIVAWGQWLAALLDALENAALLRVLLGAARTPPSWEPWLPRAAAVCASVKFSLVALGLAYAATSVLRWRISRRP